MWSFKLVRASFLYLPFQRWFVLKGNMLFYYERKDDKDPVGVIILEGCTVELSEMNDTNTFTFELVFLGSIFHYLTVVSF